MFSVILLTQAGPRVFLFVLARLRPGSLNISKQVLEGLKLTTYTMNTFNIIRKAPSETIRHDDEDKGGRGDSESLSGSDLKTASK